MGSSSSAIPVTSPLAPGYKLDRYELLGPLAEGGMASVWIARQQGKHGFEKLVAIKTILPQFAADLRFQKMFLDEARIASRIEHFNVARILDLGETHDVLYLAMEYVDGDALSKLRRACSQAGVVIPPGIVMRVLADACSGLHEAHELRSDDGRPLDVVHRDVSPHNVLVSTSGVAKIIDFGVAKARDRLAGETNVGVLKGKIQYMSPEQALGRHVDRRADVWAIGASLYHLLAGRPPYDADNTLGILHLLTSGQAPAPLPPSVHPAIAVLVRKALSHPPDRRYATAAEMRDALEAAMIDAKVPTSTSDVSAFVVQYFAERTARRRKTIDIALAAAAERQRVEAMLKPQVESTGSWVTSPPSVRLPPMPNAAAPLPKASAPAEPEDPDAPDAPTTFMQPKREPPAAAPPPACETDEIVLPRTTRPRLIVAAVVAACALATIVAFAAFRSPSRAASAGRASAASPVSPEATRAPVPTSAPPVSAAHEPAEAAPSNIPVVAATELPPAEPPPVVHPPARRKAAPAPRETPRETATAAPTPTPEPVRKKIDDGF